MFKFFLLLTIFSPIAVAQQPDSTLQFVQIWFRHGERLPTHFLNLPGDPVPSRYLEIGEPGELTNKGIMEEYELGMALRRYYGEYFDGYHPSDIYVWTGEDNRTVDSAQAVGAGLFPPSADGTWNPDLKWHPFSTHTDASIDWVSTGIQGVCPVYEVSFFSQPEYLAISKQLANQDTIEIAKKSMPMVDIEDPRDINHLFDSLYIRSILNDSRLPFPTWAEPIKDKIRVIMSDIHYRITDLQTPIIDYHREKILAFMEDHLQRKTKNKGVFMSAHDTNMMLLGKAFDISEMKYQLPFFGGHFAVELHNSNSTYYVKFFYSSSFDKPMTEVKPSYCQGKTCTLAELQSNTKDSRITSDEMLKLCRGVSSVREQPILTGSLIVLLAVLLISTLILSFTTYSYRKQVLDLKDPERQRLI